MAVTPPIEEDRRRPFLRHVEDLRRRLLRSFLWVALGTAAGWGFSERILEFVLAPMGQVVYLSPVEPFLVRLKAAFLGGIGLSFPFLAWEGWGFLRPALRPAEQGGMILLVPASMALFAGGVAFGWLMLLPSALKILSSFQSSAMVPMITVEHYFNFAGWMVLACGLIFQVPLVVLALVRMGGVRPENLLRQWRPAVVIILAAAAVLTPTPDLFNQLLLAAPLAILYGVSVGLSFWVRP